MFVLGKSSRDDAQQITSPEAFPSSTSTVRSPASNDEIYSDGLDTPTPRKRRRVSESEGSQSFASAAPSTQNSPQLERLLVALDSPATNRGVLSVHAESPLLPLPLHLQSRLETYLCQAMMVREQHTAEMDGWLRNLVTRQAQDLIEDIRALSKTVDVENKIDEIDKYYYDLASIVRPAMFNGYALLVSEDGRKIDEQVRASLLEATWEIFWLRLGDYLEKIYASMPPPEIEGINKATRDNADDVLDFARKLLEIKSPNSLRDQNRNVVEGQVERVCKVAADNGSVSVVSSVMNLVDDMCFYNIELC